jgi:hypothetical protein
MLTEDMKCSFLIFPVVLVLMGCSTSFEALHPEFGSSFNAYDCTYDDLWDVAVEVAGRNVTILDTNKSRGFIGGEYRPSIVGWLSNPRPGELVSVTLSPGADKGTIHTVEVVSRKIGGAWPFGRDWEPTIVEGIKSHFPGNVAARTQKNRWSAITTKGDTLAGIFLERLVSDTLQFTRVGQRFSVLVSDVIQLRESKERRFWDWVGTGTILGAVAGSLVGPSLSEVEFKGLYGSFYGAFHGMAYGAIVGGALEEIASGDRVYDLKKLEPPDRILTINAILSNRM